ncbi:hypothetical protein BKA70DRAFT_1538034 [Coprinopsis sp. MPI-PUGE-AT-0042]|nr:hypothetical protein BKA70DRAFT_1538034 [Coprinopsis sp. MPI-PUGE-AT-0042]
MSLLGFRRWASGWVAALATPPQTASYATWWALNDTPSANLIRESPDAPHTGNGFLSEDLEGNANHPCSKLAPMLASALRYMINIRRFDLESNAEGLMKHSSALAKSILSLQSLTSLMLSDVGPAAANSLKEAVEALGGSSQLRVRNLKISEVENRFPPREAFLGLERFLSHLSPHLVELRIDNFDLRRLMSQADGPAVVLPNVRRLRVDFCRVSVQEISTSFPNVTLLTLDLGSEETATQQLHRASNRDSSLFPRLVFVSAFVKAVPELVALKATFNTESPQDFDLIGWTDQLGTKLLQGTHMPPLFSSVRLEFMMLRLTEKGGSTNDVDRAEFSRNAALTWAKNVLTLKYIVLFTGSSTQFPWSQYIYVFKVIRGEDRMVRDMQHIPDKDSAGIGEGHEQRIRTGCSALHTYPVYYQLVDDINERCSPSSREDNDADRKEAKRISQPPRKHGYPNYRPVKKFRVSQGRWLQVSGSVQTACDK